MSAQHWEARQRQRALEYREEKRRAAIAATEADAATDSGLILDPVNIKIEIKVFSYVALSQRFSSTKRFFSGIFVY